MIPNINHLIFDVDGTLIDPWVGMTRSVAYAFEQFGKKFNPDTSMRLFVGPPLGECFRELLGHDNPELVAEALRLYRERFAAVGISECRLYDGVYEMLESLQGRYELYIATARVHWLTELLLNHFGILKFFNAAYGTGPDGRFDNKAELLKHIVTEHRLDPAHCVMIGDRKHDVIAARESGMESIGVTYGYGTPIELIESMPGRLADSPQEILTLLQKPGTL